MKGRHVGSCRSLVLLAFLCVGCAGIGTTSESGRVFEATAQGLPAAGAVNASQKRLTALEAAKHCAMAKLVEAMRGVHISRVSKVRDFQFAGEEVEAEVRGELVGLEIVRSEYDGESGIAEVTVRAALRGHTKDVPDWHYHEEDEEHED